MEKEKKESYIEESDGKLIHEKMMAEYLLAIHHLDSVVECRRRRCGVVHSNKPINRHDSEGKFELQSKAIWVKKLENSGLLRHLKDQNGGPKQRNRQGDAHTSFRK